MTMQKSLEEIKEITERLMPLMDGMRRFCKELGKEDIISLFIADNMVSCSAIADDGRTLDITFWARGDEDITVRENHGRDDE